MEYYSPALSVTSDMTDEELDKYFATYVPLSNLPTPPPAKEYTQPHTVRQTTSPHSPELQAQATHLAKLVPAKTNAHVICALLERANLPAEVVAFAACVLEGLSGRFMNSWWDELEQLKLNGQQQDLKRQVRKDVSHCNSDLIVLAALALAHGFLTDRLRSSRHWSVKESDGMFGVREIEATERAMLRDLNYGLSKIKEDAVQKMLGEMGTQKKTRRGTMSIDLKGTAIWNHGVQTPEPSP
ncbi:hypothetical protein DE146DRAFT_205021 [Phaeosphaeria sp. MPI-PUGE-AT-0046c]|nr:hypothetical protein DE146DRAFT_205021 [Phaeosphaeria sp. MPI-PUGE-AT-0046c]